jgi:hypothetical protein
MTGGQMTGEQMRALEAEVAAVRGELTRLDAKCGTLASVAGIGAAVLTGQITHGPVAARVLLAAAGLLLAVAAVLLLWILRPRMGRTGWCRWAHLDAQSITVAFTRGDAAVRAADDLHVLSAITMAKQIRLRRAVDLLVAAVAVVAAALVAGAVA